MNRRDFVIRLAALPLLGACGRVREASDLQTTGNLIVTSSLMNGHTHRFVIPRSEIAEAPASFSGSDSIAQGHSHIVTLTQAHLLTLRRGGTVTVVSSAAPHTHTYTIRNEDDEYYD